MSRIRAIKPGFFKNEHLAELPPLTRILFAGLWTLADRNGRLEDRPKRIKAELLPYDDCDVNVMLDALSAGPAPFIIRYVSQGDSYVEVVNFSKHQMPHHTEKQGVIPSNGVLTVNSPLLHRESPGRVLGIDLGVLGMGNGVRDLASTKIKPLPKRVAKVKKDQDHRASRERRSQKANGTEPDPNPKLLAKFAFEVITAHPNDPVSEWTAHLKTLAAARRIDYTPEAIRKALTAAEEATRRKNRA